MTEFMVFVPLDDSSRFVALKEAARRRLEFERIDADEASPVEAG